MALDMFLRIDGIKGESVDGGQPNHKGDIDVLAWSWGLSNSGSAQAGGGTAGAGRVSVQDLSLTKYVDIASPFLTLAVCDGRHLSAATLFVRKAGLKIGIEYVAYKMEEVLVTSLSTGGSGGEDRLTENITLNFAKIAWTYVPTDQLGNAGRPITRSWDIAGNQPG